MRLQPAPARVALALGGEEGANVIRRQRVTYGEDNAPVSPSTSWFVAELGDRVPQLLQTERVVGGTPKAIEEHAGWSWQDSQDLVGARVATDEEADLLGITERSSALRVGYNCLFDTETVIEYGEYISHGGWSPATPTSVPATDQHPWGRSVITCGHIGGASSGCA